MLKVSKACEECFKKQTMSEELMLFGYVTSKNTIFMDTTSKKQVVAEAAADVSRKAANVSAQAARLRSRKKSEPPRTRPLMRSPM